MQNIEAQPENMPRLPEEELLQHLQHRGAAAAYALGVTSAWNLLGILPPGLA